jgi:hypothetical protein
MSKIGKQASFSEYFAKNFPKPRKFKFTNKQKSILKPIAEVIALIDGNAFFGISSDDNGEDIWYEQYLPEAYVVYKQNGGDKGWASQVSWVLDAKHENASVRDAYQHWQLLKILARKKQ